jgi:hypothetical protein
MYQYEQRWLARTNVLWIRSMTFFQFNGYGSDIDPDLTIKLGLFFESVQCTVHNVGLHQDI